MQMLPKINNKELIDCEASDFEVLLNNPDYRENQYLDYKQDFDHLRIPKEKQVRDDKIAELRNDICSFANAEGGYIIYGIEEKDGMAAAIKGIEIENVDSFELDLRNILEIIKPKIPSLEIKFVSIDAKRYLVVIRIEHDYYSPYINMDNEKKYNVFKRNGNKKIVVGYTELRNMFIHSRYLEDEILNFRNKRIEYYKGSFERFILFHIIPESFLEDRKDLFIMEKQKHIFFGSVYSGTQIDSISFPCVDGIRYINMRGEEKGIIYNNGTAEFFLPLTRYVTETQDGLCFYAEAVWKNIDCVLQGFRAIIPAIFGNQRYFGCITIFGCKDVISDELSNGVQHIHIDRNEIVCEPVPFTNIMDYDIFCLNYLKLHLEYYLSLGIRSGSKVDTLIEKIT